MMQTDGRKMRAKVGGRIIRQDKTKEGIYLTLGEARLKLSVRG